MAKAKVTIKKNLVCYYAAITQDVKKEVVEEPVTPEDPESPEDSDENIDTHDDDVVVDEPDTNDTNDDSDPDTPADPEEPKEPEYEIVSETKFYKLETNDEDYSPFIEYDEPTWEEVAEEDLPKELFQIKTVKVPFIDEETEEEKIIIYEYYYQLQEKEIEVDRYIKGICTSCLYCIETSRYWRKHYECTHPEHMRENYINGMSCNGDCRDFNMHGECKLYTSILEDDITDDTINADDQNDDNQNANEPNENDPTVDEVIDDITNEVNP